ncbi:uncharacterized protein CELE_C08E3.14 [Caenorhabditis elegans]|uniref:Uncharacterized protein n=1 Tax=Caenorhabditis elegans TaxID=6239 RepID=Q4W507_CAEEL|nr:Uncharacterized protein CELE_C08E3.14 [Caenorhabditis elegans]CCD63679.1 Uncharacterized protein CELE_C08E3.14 [Caenorhabditis elegans]|eukprot:NP_001021935.1 Uncharacterized protein CELE_C08E3.14 [Caenorhabditis elegans]
MRTPLFLFLLSIIPRTDACIKLSKCSAKPMRFFAFFTKDYGKNLGNNFFSVVYEYTPHDVRTLRTDCELQATCKNDSLVQVYYPDLNMTRTDYGDGRGYRPGAVAFTSKNQAIGVCDIETQKWKITTSNLHVNELSLAVSSFTFGCVKFNPSSVRPCACSPGRPSPEENRDGAVIIASEDNCELSVSCPGSRNMLYVDAVGTKTYVIGLSPGETQLFVCIDARPTVSTYFVNGKFVPAFYFYCV